MAKCGHLGNGRALIVKSVQQPWPGSLLVEDASRRRENAPAGRSVHNTATHGAENGGPYIDQGFGQGRPIHLRRAVHDRHFVVCDQATPCIGVENPADANHAESPKLGRAQGPHAGAADDRNASRHQDQQLLVSGWRARYIEKTIDQHHSPWPRVGQGQGVTGHGGRTPQPCLEPDGRRADGI